VNISEITIEITAGGTSQKLAISSTSAQSAAAAAAATENKGAPIKYLVTPDVNCFVRKAANPTAVSDGTDQLLLANNTYRVELMDGEKLAFITTAASGSVYITPRA
jgi:acetyl-CoA acetyltransferase